VSGLRDALPSLQKGLMEALDQSRTVPALKENVSPMQTTCSIPLEVAVLADAF